MINQEGTLKPTICEETIEKLTAVFNNHDLSVDDTFEMMAGVLADDPYWAQASEEQIEHFLNVFIPRMCELCEGDS